MERKSLDSYAIFIERGCTILSINGLLGFITPDTFLRKTNLFPLRKFLLLNTAIKQLLETGPLFSQVRDTWCLVFIIEKTENKKSKILHRKISRFVKSVEERLTMFGKSKWTYENEVQQSVWINSPKMIIGYLANEYAQRIIKKIEIWPTLGSLFDLYSISRGEEGSKFNIKSDEHSNYYMIIPSNIERYYVEEGVRVNKNTLTKSKYEKIYSRPKIWIIRIQKMRWKQRLVSAFDDRRNSCAMKTIQSISSISDDENSLKYLSGILSSKLINFWCVNYLADDLNQSYLSMIPVRTINSQIPDDLIKFDRLILLVDHMLDLHKRTPQTPNDKQRLQDEIAATDAQIDRLVYELYGLTDEEIRIVEGEGV
jgi:hypothetical protein